MKEFTLKNDIKSVYKQNKNTPRMAFTLNVAITEPEKLAGTYSLMNRLLLQGTKKYSNTELAKVLDENAIELYTDLKKRYSTFPKDRYEFVDAICESNKRIHCTVADYTDQHRKIEKKERRENRRRRQINKRS